MADTPDDALIEAMARGISLAEGVTPGTDPWHSKAARAAHAALVEHLGLTEETQDRYRCPDDPDDPSWAPHRRLVSKWVEVQP